MNERKRILFVDDEPRVLAGLRRMLYSASGKWETMFAPGGREALAMIALHPFDVIVSDIRMPGMTGVELLHMVKQEHPRTVRIALSGQAEKTSVLRSVGHVHQYLSKPCEAEMLKAVLTRVCNLNGLLPDEALRGVTLGMETVPSLPELYNALIDELSSPKASIRAVQRIVSQDVGMVCRMLQLLSTAFFGQPVWVSSPAQAVEFLGLDHVKSLALTTSAFASFNSSVIAELSLEDIWPHSRTVGALAARIAADQGGSVQTVQYAMVAGMLHDVGKLVLAASAPEAYASTQRLAREQGLRLTEAERQTMGATHAEVGAHLAGIWGLHEPIVEALAQHHSPLPSSPEESAVPTAVRLANALCHRERPACDDGEDTTDADCAAMGLADRLPAWRQLCHEITQKETADARQDLVC